MQQGLGYEMIPEKVRVKLFGDPLRNVSPATVAHCQSLLEEKGFPLPPAPTGLTFPEWVLDELPDLEGNTIQEHFNNIALEQLGDIPDRAQQFVECTLPPVPPMENLRLVPGWTRYAKDGGITSVPHPLEKVFTFDTETFVNGGSYPIIGTAVSPEACYIWLSPEFLQGQGAPKDMVPVGTGNLAIGHFVSYDRVRTKEAYTLETGLENYWLDTLSMHIAHSGLASGQRWLYVLSNKDPELLTKEERNQMKYRPQWLEAGSTNSLVEVYNFHVYETKKWNGDKGAKPMVPADKLIRDIFVKAKTLAEMQPLLVDLIMYAIKDAWLTAELFQFLYPRYRDSTPSPVALMGHFYLGGSRVPLTPNWEEWKQDCETEYQDRLQQVTVICRGLLMEEYLEWLECYNKDTEGMTKAEKKKLTHFPHISQWAKSDPWRKQSDWKPKIIGNSKKFPEWKGKVLPNWCATLIMDEYSDIGVKTKAAHLLLKLKWMGEPLRLIDGKGWCFGADEDKVPHPKRPGENVGGLLGKDFVKAGEAGILSSDLDEAKVVLGIANEISYWTSVRGRVSERFAIEVNNPCGEDALVTIPVITPHGTTTRRVVEPLFATMCSTKSYRIGTELKTRIEAPDGWKIVGGDFDSQEVRIAAAFADSWEGGIIGGSPIGYQLLSGSKEEGTDPHTSIAREAFPQEYQGIVFTREQGICEEC